MRPHSSSTTTAHPRFTLHKLLLQASSFLGFPYHGFNIKCLLKYPCVDCMFGSDLTSMHMGVGAAESLRAAESSMGWCLWSPNATHVLLEHTPVEGASQGFHPTALC